MACKHGHDRGTRCQFCIGHAGPDPHRYGVCTRAPRGWYCTRSSHHDGPCAAHPRWWVRLLGATRS
jgi:hypothetical protein